MLMRDRLSRVLVLLFLVAITCACGCAFCQSGPGSEEATNITYHSTVSEVRLMFFASDEYGHTVEELQEDDFAVVDDERVIRNFRSFTHSALIKLDVVVLIDASESVLPHLQQEITDVLQLIAQGTWNAQHKLLVLSFSGTETHLICTENCSSVLTADLVASLPTGGTTPLFDAVEVAANSLIERRQLDVWPVNYSLLRR